MIVNTNALVVRYPNLVGDCGRYELRDQRTYFSKFQGGASYIFELALYNLVCGDLQQYELWCNDIFDNYYLVLFEENTTTREAYHDDRREFNRRIFDIYRFAKSSLSSVGQNLGFSSVTKLAFNRTFDTSSFLVK